MLLQAKGRVTERELAERLEVSQRTVHRDMEALSAARVPISAVRGAQGGWELEKGWRTQVPGLDEAELRALLMAQPRAIGHPRLMAAAESALNKLMAALPGPMRAQAAEMRERLHIDPTGWRGQGEDMSMLAPVQQAVADGRKLAFDYTRADGQKGPRTVDPLGMVAKGLTWYLVARASTGMRTYRVSRMEAVTPLVNSFERPAQFDLAVYWKQSTARLEEQRGSFRVLLSAAPAAVRKLAMWCVTKQIDDRAQESGFKDAPAGWVELEADFENEGMARFVVLGLGAQIKVLGPEEFAQGIVAEVEAVADLLIQSETISSPGRIGRVRPSLPR
jgi:predicted DNA-binding transcriptional regulator YafY